MLAKGPSAADRGSIEEWGRGVVRRQASFLLVFFSLEGASVCMCMLLSYSVTEKTVFYRLIYRYPVRFTAAPGRFVPF